MRLETLAVHGGYSPDPTTRAVSVPIYQTVAYAFDKVADGLTVGAPTEMHGSAVALAIAPAAVDTTSPVVTLRPPASIVARTITLAATASDNIGVVGVRFLLDGSTQIGAEDTASPFGVTWDTTTATNGTHTLTAQARDAAGNVATSAPVTVTVDNQGPTGTIVIDGGSEITNSRRITQETT